MGLGREELRSTCLKPYWLRVRDERGDPAARALLATSGLPPAAVADDTAWISVSAARRALAAFAAALGEAELASHGAWMTHPESLGAYVRLMRASSTPEDAYRHLAASASESTRVGAWDVEALGPAHARLVYTPRGDTEAEQADRLLCLARQAELRGLPRLWGLEEATLTHPECLSESAGRCVYEVAWRPPLERRLTLAGAIGGAIASGATVAVAGNWLAAAISCAVGAGLGYVAGASRDRARAEQAAKTFQRHRIVGLERGLEQRGQARVAPGDLTGSTLAGRYRILQRIGSGGIGTVYAAEHVALGTQVAIKVLRGAAAVDAAEVARLRREAQVQGVLEHPNVVKTLDLDQMPDGSIFVVMELMRGHSLAERLKRRGPLDAAAAIEIFLPVCEALAAAHDLGIVHRDLKPANVFLCEDGGVKVLDFGMSKFSEADTLTQTGYTLGTPEYMAPEQCVGGTVDPRTDLYAFGVLMYEALSGRLPITGRTRQELLELHQRARVVPLREARPDRGIPPAVDDAVLACLAKRPADRPSSARELAALLRLAFPARRAAG